MHPDEANHQPGFFLWSESQSRKKQLWPSIGHNEEDFTIFSTSLRWKWARKMSGGAESRNEHSTPRFCNFEPQNVL
jgi:hypothetical protein